MKHKIFLGIIIAFHSILFVLNIIPNYMYASIGAINYFSLVILCIDILCLILLFFIKNQSTGKYMVRINILFLIPALVYSMFLEDIPSRTTDKKYFLKFDQEKTLMDVSWYFPVDVKEEDIIEYSYYFTNSWGTATEVSLVIKANKEIIESLFQPLHEKYPSTLVEPFTLNSSLSAFIIHYDEINSEQTSIKSKNIKLVLFSEEQEFIFFEYLIVQGDVMYTKDIFYLDFISRY